MSIGKILRCAYITHHPRHAFSPSFERVSQVGMLGANAPESVKQSWNISIAGPVVYPTTSRWGHMISAHYLKHLKKGDYPGSKLHTYMSKANEPEHIVATSH